MEVTDNTGKVYSLDVVEGRQYEFDTSVKILIRKDVI